VLLLLSYLQVGLWMMVRAMRDRNYMEANDVYLRLAIGNAPWPIGVTSVGIHERSAREKISHVMNTSGQAHIMNDEATRKYFQVSEQCVRVSGVEEVCFCQIGVVIRDMLRTCQEALNWTSVGYIDDICGGMYWPFVRGMYQYASEIDSFSFVDSCDGEILKVTALEMATMA
jgi:hypothetical protein